MKRVFLHRLWLALVLIGEASPAATLDSHRVANVEAQFANLQYHGEALS